MLPTRQRTATTGLTAFPMTPIGASGVDETGYARLVSRLVAAGVDSIAALGSTGGYAYLGRAERRRVAETAVREAGDTPVMVGIGALRTADVLALAEDAQQAGAAAVLLAPMTYLPLTDDEVHDLYADVTAVLSVPLCVYDNPTTTGFTFTDELHARIARLPQVAAVKIPPVPGEPAEVSERVARLRALLPGGVTIGTSGDPYAAAALNAGCETWYSALAGLLPAPCLEITRAATAGDADRARALSAGLEPVWALFRRYGSLRVVAAAAEQLELVSGPALPRPLQGLDADGHRAVAAALARVD